MEFFHNISKLTHVCGCTPNSSETSPNSYCTAVMTCAKVVCHNVLGDVSVFINTQLFMKAYPFSYNFWWMQRNRMSSYTTFENCTRTGHTFTVLGSWDHRTAFSKAASRKKTSCNPHQPQVGQWRHVNRKRILPEGKWYTIHEPWERAQCDLRSSSGIRVEVKAIYFRPSLGCLCSGWPKWWQERQREWFLFCLGTGCDMSAELS